MNIDQSGRILKSLFPCLRSAWFYVCLLCLSAIQYPIMGLTGQAAEAQAPPSSLSSNIIRVSSNLVTLPVSVTDSGGRAVDNLGSRDFLIEEDGRPEAISRLSEAGQSPLRLVLLFDLSGSVNSRFQFEQQAAIRFLEKIWREGDRVSVIAFSGQPHLSLQASDSLAEALQVLSRLQPTESPTAFFDSVIAATRILRQSVGPETRQSIIALSDGEDNRSEHNLSDVLSEVHRSDAIFYSINPVGAALRLNEISRQGQTDLECLAKETGGNAFVSDKTVDLDAVFSRIAADLRAQYLLSYYSSNLQIDGKFREILVSTPQRPDLRVRARRGYNAARR